MIASRNGCSERMECSLAGSHFVCLRFLYKTPHPLLPLSRNVFVLFFFSLFTNKKNDENVYFGLGALFCTFLDRQRAVRPIIASTHSSASLAST